ncbi:hypothetical protein ACFL56_00195 [Candidatus Margulisiibacteriota bacterium]
MNHKVILLQREGVAETSSAESLGFFQKIKKRYYKRHLRRLIIMYGMNTSKEIIYKYYKNIPSAFLDKNILLTTIPYLGKSNIIQTYTSLPEDIKNDFEINKSFLFQIDIKDILTFYNSLSEKYQLNKDYINLFINRFLRDLPNFKDTNFLDILFSLYNSLPSQIKHYDTIQNFMNIFNYDNINYLYSIKVDFFYKNFMFSNLSEMLTVGALHFYEMLPKKIQNNPDFISHTKNILYKGIAANKFNENIFGLITNDNLKVDNDTIDLLIKNSPNYLPYNLSQLLYKNLKSNLKKDKDLLLKLINLNSDNSDFLYKELDISLQSDKDIVLLFIKNSSKVSKIINLLPSALKEDKNFILSTIALIDTPDFYSILPEKLHNDDEIISEYIKKNLDIIDDVLDLYPDFFEKNKSLYTHLMNSIKEEVLTHYNISNYIQNNIPEYFITHDLLIFILKNIELSIQDLDFIQSLNKDNNKRVTRKVELIKNKILLNSLLDQIKHIEYDRKHIYHPKVTDEVTTGRKIEVLDGTVVKGGSAWRTKEIDETETVTVSEAWVEEVDDPFTEDDVTNVLLIFKDYPVSICIQALSKIHSQLAEMVKKEFDVEILRRILKEINDSIVSKRKYVIHHKAKKELVFFEEMKEGFYDPNTGFWQDPWSEEIERIPIENEDDIHKYLGPSASLDCFLTSKIETTKEAWDERIDRSFTEEDMEDTITIFKIKYPEYISKKAINHINKELAELVKKELGW